MEKNSTTLIKGGMDFVIIFHNTSETAEKPIVPDREKRKKKKQTLAIILNISPN